MSSSPRIGDHVQLPSGKRVRVMAPADPARPWHVESVDGAWILKRPGRQGYFEHYFGADGPLHLDEADAQALRDILAAVKG